MPYGCDELFQFDQHTFPGYPNLREADRWVTMGDRKIKISVSHGFLEKNHAASSDHYFKYSFSLFLMECKLHWNLSMITSLKKATCWTAMLNVIFHVPVRSCQLLEQCDISLYTWSNKSLFWVLLLNQIWKYLLITIHYSTIGPDYEGRTVAVWNIVGRCLNHIIR